MLSTCHSYSTCFVWCYYFRREKGCLHRWKSSCLACTYQTVSNTCIYIMLSRSTVEQAVYSPAEIFTNYNYVWICECDVIKHWWDIQADSAARYRCALWHRYSIYSILWFWAAGTLIFTSIPNCQIYIIVLNLLHHGHSMHDIFTNVIDNASDVRLRNKQISM